VVGTAADTPSGAAGLAGLAALGAHGGALGLVELSVLVLVEFLQHLGMARAVGGGRRGCRGRFVRGPDSVRGKE